MLEELELEEADLIDDSEVLHNPQTVPHAVILTPPTTVTPAVPSVSSDAVTPSVIVSDSEPLR